MAVFVRDLQPVKLQRCKWI